MFTALAGTDTQYLIDMLEWMFREGPLVDPEELLTGDVKAKFDATHAEEAVIAQTAGDPDPATKTILYCTVLVPYIVHIVGSLGCITLFNFVTEYCESIPLNHTGSYILLA